MERDKRPIEWGYRRFIVSLFVVMALFSIIRIANAASLYVNPNNVNCPAASGNVYCTISEAINAASNSDVISIAPGIYEESLVISSGTSRSLTIRGSGISHTFIKSTTRGFLVNENLSIGNLTIDGVGPPKSGTGGGVYIANNAIVDINNVVVSNNHGGAGGGIAVISGSLTLHRVAVVNNTAEILAPNTSSPASAGGGIYVAAGASLTAVNSAIVGNYANIGITPQSPGPPYQYSGGFAAGIYNLGTSKLINTTVRGNIALATDIAGGGITNGNDQTAATLDLYNVTISGNSATIGGGGVYNVNGTVNVRNSIIAENTDDGTATNCGGNSFFSLDNNLIGVSTGCDNTVFPISTNDHKDVSATQLSFLPFPGNGTAFDNIPIFLTYGLSVNSIALDAVGVNSCLDQNNSQLTTDQRGVARPFDGDNNGSSLCDIGAYELVQDIMVYPAQQITYEDQGSSTLYVALAAPPTQTVQVNINSQDSSEGTIATPILSFNSTDWSTPKPVQIDVQNDGILDGDQTYSINLTASGISVQPKSVSITNMDTVVAPGLIVKPTSIDIREGGAPASVSIRLTTPPTAGSVVNLSIDNDRTGLDQQEIISPSTLSFNDTNWNSPQTITVTAVDDILIDGDLYYNLVVAVANSTDSAYATIPNTNISVINRDNDVPTGNPGVTFSPSPGSGLATSESGGQVTINVVLNSMPSADVTINFVSNDPNEGLIQVGQNQQQSAQLVFTRQNWNMPQSITVVGVDDNYVDGGRNYSILTEISSLDVSYSAYNPADIPITNNDDDNPELAIIPITGLTTSESGTSATFQVQLAKPPAPTTQVALSVVAQPPSPGLPLEGSITLPATQLIFDSVNYNVPQTVTVTGIDDNIIDCSKTYNVVISIDGVKTTSGPYLNSGLTGMVSVTNTDNDVTSTPQIVFSKTQLNTSENGTADSFNVCLTTQPSAPVTIHMAIPQTAANEGAFSGNVLSQDLIIDQNNWTEVQTVTVTGIDDAVADGPQTYQLEISPPVSNDSNYNNQTISVISVTNADNEEACTSSPNPFAAGLCTDTILIETTESGGSGEFRVKLTRQPTNSVIVKITITDPTEGQIFDPANGRISMQRLTFYQYNWNIEQTVTIIGVDDTEDDGNITYQLQLDTSESFAPEYQNIDLPNITVINRDNDRAKPNDPNAGGALDPGMLWLLLAFFIIRLRYRLSGRHHAD